MSFLALKIYDAFVCAHVCMDVLYLCMYYLYRYDLCTPTYPKMHAILPYKFDSRIVTVMVVKNRAVTERQSRVRLVVFENIIPRGQKLRYIFWQEYCRAPYNYIIFFEIMPSKNSKTSYTQSRCKYSWWAHRPDVQLPPGITAKHVIQDAILRCFMFPCTHFQGSWMVQEICRRAVAVEFLERPCWRQQSAGSAGTSACLPASVK